MITDIHAVNPEEDQEKVAQLFKRYNLVAMPVIDEAGLLLGRILYDDVVDVLQEEADEDIMHIAGTTTGEPELVYTDQLFRIAGMRLPWLLATLAGLAVPAVLTRGFQITFPHMDILVPFVLVIGAMGGFPQPRPFSFQGVGDQFAHGPGMWNPVGVGYPNLAWQYNAVCDRGHLHDGCHHRLGHPWCSRAILFSPGKDRPRDRRWSCSHNH